MEIGSTTTQIVPKGCLQFVKVVKVKRCFNILKLMQLFANTIVLLLQAFLLKKISLAYGAMLLSGQMELFPDLTKM